MTATVRGISVAGRDGSVDKIGDREYTVVYKVGTDDRNDGPSTVRTAFGIPNLGDLYMPGNDFDSGAVVVGKTVRQGDSPWAWEVDVTYSSKLDEVRVIDNPLNAPPEISYGFQMRRVRINGMFNDPGNVPSNKAYDVGIYAPNGELFDPQPEIEIAEPILTVKRNIQTINGAVMMALANAVNSDYWQGAEPRQLRMMAPQAASKQHSTVGRYWEINYSIAYKYETWDVQLLNQGSYWFTGGAPAAKWSSATRNSTRDIAGNPVLVNLSTNGDRNTTSTPTFTRLRVYREINFSSLGII